MKTPTPDTATIVAAFAAREQLDLSPAEHQRLSEYVLDTWDMADRLRDVDPPGLEGQRERLPKRAAYCNQPPPAAAVAPAARSVSSVARSQEPLPDGTLDRGLVELASAIEVGDVTPLSLVTGQLERIHRFDGLVRSYITVNSDGALAEAADLTAELEEKGPRSPLHGMPIGAKDNIPAAGMACTYNSPFMREWTPRRDSEAVRRLRNAGAILVGKHNLNEFGWSLPSEDDLVAPPRNPWLPQEYSVGSSSGGGAAVAARLAVAALGTDGGGSIRLPAAQHLLFGLKPGHGRVPSEGVTDGRVSEVSILTRRAEDAAAVLSALLIDPDDSSATQRLQRESMHWIEFVRSQPGKLRVAVPERYTDDVGMEDDVKRAFDATCRTLQDLGHELTLLAKPTLHILHDAVRANFIVIAAEHYFDHEGPGKDRGRYGESAGFYNLPGACLTAADYLHALRVGEQARQAVEEVLVVHDLIVTPTTPVTRTSTARNPKTHRRGGNAAYTSPFNITGHPALSIPVGMSREGMPIGMQLVGRVDSEFELLRAGRSVVSTLDLPPFPDLEHVEALAASR